MAASLGMELGSYDEVVKLCRSVRAMGNVSEVVAARAMLKEAYAWSHKGYIHRCERLLMSVERLYLMRNEKHASLKRT